MGCSLEASMQNLSAEAIIQKKSPLKNFIAGSTPKNQTSRGYRVEAATGSYIDQKNAQTTGGYKVYISLQGNISTK